MLTLLPEEQMLVAALSLAERNNLVSTAPQSIADVQAFGPFYFGMYCADWAGATANLQAQGMVDLHDDQLSLTAPGAARAGELRVAHPRQIYAYNEFYYRARRSAAHARFCERVYGRDLCQHGMADMGQINALVEELKANRAHSILELGCGNGALAAYFADHTGANVTGVDFAEEGIRWAREFAAQRPGRLTFHTADMTTIDFTAASFDTVILVDAAYFVQGLAAFLRRLLTWLRPAGKLYVFYSAWVGNPEQRDQLQSGSTPFAQALNELNMPFEFIDYSAGEAAHWLLKRQVAEEMKSEFEAEGNAWLQHRRWIEAECHRPYVENGNVTRYLYKVGKY